MKDLYSQLIPSFSYVQEAAKKPQRKSVEVFLKKEPLLSEKELLNKIINTSYNKKWPDGRIYGLSKDGKYVSHSVTPYAKTFLNNIEEKIKPLVLALKTKGYFSISSCEGHCLWDKRYVMIVFPSRESAIDFQSLLPFKLTYNLRQAIDVLNTTVDFDKNGNLLNVEKKTLEENKKNTLNYINAFIKRNYTDAWLLEMNISNEIKYEKGIIKYIKNFKQIFFKKILIKYQTSKITEYITEKLPAFIY